MAACPDYEPLIAERASGELAPDDARKLDLHLATCPRCTAELAAYQQAFGYARLPAVSDAERKALKGLSAAAHGELDRAPVYKALGRLLTLTAVAAAIVVVIANRVILPGAKRSAEPRPVAAAGWTEPDPDRLLARVAKENPELAVASDDELSRAERIADAVYLKAVNDQR